MRYLLFNQFIFVIVVIFIPLPTIQHFKWPVSQCLMADICNHTWINDCGKDNTSTEIRLFLDTCDMNEFNCDNNRQFMPVAYSECFKKHTGCPVVKCQSNPACKKLDLRRVGDQFMAVPSPASVSIKKSWVEGRRRYTKKKKFKKPIKPIKKPRSTTRLPPKKSTTKKKFQLKKSSSTINGLKTKTVIIKKETVWRNGKLFHKIVKGIQHIEDDSDWLEGPPPVYI